MNLRRLSLVLTVTLAGCGHATPPLDGPRGENRYHRIERGETLWSIGQLYGVPHLEIAAANRLPDATRIRAGDVIYIPSPGEVRPARPASPPRASAPPSRPGPRATSPPRRTPPEVVAKSPPPRSRSWDGRFHWPLDKPTVTSGYGDRNGAMHHGLDLAAPEGTPIKASAAGKVLYSGNGLAGYGNLVILDHGDDYRTIYAHNRSNRVGVGQEVRRGDVIAYVGQTGRASAPHCHFEIRRRTKALNPMNFLP